MQSDSLPTPESAPEPSLNARLMSAGVSESYASLLANGHRRPSLDLALELETKLGLAPSFWRDRPDLAEAASTPPGCPA
jgi:transcriptional regulator with XRE-family HTH domain